MSWKRPAHNKWRQADQISARSSLQFARCAGRLGGVMDLARVPKSLHHLAIWARKYGVADDLGREQIVDNAVPEERAQLMQVVYGADDSFDAWLAGPESIGPAFSDEYIAFVVA